MVKHFKTIEELVEILNSRGVLTDADTEMALKRESYYAIVNGYKKPFLDTRSMEAAPGDVFLPGTQFSWIYNLFQFDRELRIVAFKYLTKAEAVMRTAVVYAFCEAHQEENAYLDRNNFCAASTYLVPKAFKGSKAALHTDNLQELMKRLNDKLVVRKGTRDFIKHYVKAHSSVPLWVLSNDLTFGNIVHFYQLMQEKDRRRACALIAEAAGRNSKAKGTLSERTLLRSATVLNHFRNICAHDERLYCARYSGEGLGMVVGHLGVFLTPEGVRAFVTDVVTTFHGYKDRIHSMNFDDLLVEMGFSEGAARGNG